MAKTVSEKYEKLIKNSAIFLIGNMGSKIIAFLIVPFYTYVLTTEEYGSADLVTTTVNLVLPFAMLGMNEAVLRYAASKELSPNVIASNSLFVVLSLIAISWILLPFFRMISVIGDYVVFYLLLLNLMSFIGVFLQLLRGMGKSKSFAANGVIVTFTMAIANVIALAVLNLGVDGYLVSMIIAQLIGSAHIVVALKLWRLVSLRSIDFKELKSMLVYCIPLIPNSIMWWIMSASNRYIILAFLGSAANGLFNVAQKIPTLVNVVYGIFMQAWQVSAIEERESEENAEFQSTVFRYVFAVLALVSSFVAASAEPVYTMLMSSDYADSWRPVALLALADFLCCLGMFFGTTYVVTKESRRAFGTTIVGAGANVLFTFMLVPIIGIMGAALSAVFGYAVMALVRYRDTRKYVQLEINRFEVAAGLGVVSFQSVISFFPYGIETQAVSAAAFVVLVFLLRRPFASASSIILNKFKRKKIS